MSWILFTELILFALFIQTTAEDNTKYYVAPLPDSRLNPDCVYNQSCMDLDNFASGDYDQENITLMFLKGNHILPNFGERRSTHLVYNQILIMVGLSTDVIIHDINLYFYDTLEFQINNLVLSNGLFYIVMPQGTTKLSLFSVTLIDFVLYVKDTTLAQLNDCVFTNGANPLTIHRSKVILSGNSNFFNNHNSAFVSYNSDITLSGTVSFVNNTGIRGGAMALYSSTVFLSGLNARFINNSAQETGGAINIEPDMTRNVCPECFYHIQGQYTGITLYYSNNRAKLGGDNIYGTALALCKYYEPINIFSSNISMSSVSSDPTQVCICDSGDQPQCKNMSEILTSKSIHPGEKFTISAVLVGGDYGTTIGTVHANFVSASYSSLPVLEYKYQYSQWIDNTSECTNLQYTVYSEHIGQNFTMYLTVHFSKHIDDECYPSGNTTTYRYYSKTLAFVNLTILPCPMGFSLFEKPSTCDCHLILTVNGVECKIINGKSYFAWNNTLWINVNPKGFTYARYCPLNYCDQAQKMTELENNPSAQCAFNRAGRLCGGCKENYSLAIGSSHCIHCPNNNGLALLIFFAAAGFLLVFFINGLNITLTQGLLDGLIFYANIVWTYRSVLFHEGNNINTALIFLKTFIAWLNLDFGIETCFVQGLNAYWKTWLQFVFPFYIWAIAGLMVLSARHSKTLTKLYSNRVVPVLATLFLLSYTKLLRVVTSIYMFSDLLQYPDGSILKVWSVDGNINYFGLPHILLLVAALIVQIFLWLPYTLTLLFYQQLQKVSHTRIFNWVTNLKPFFDVHFAPFKPAHRYWFGVLLLARGVLLAIFSSSFATPKNTNLLLLLTLVLILLLYMAIIQPYKNKVILIIQSSFLANILLLSAFVFYAKTHENKYTLRTTAVSISIGVTFLQFCGIIICNVIRLCYCIKRNSYRNRANFELEEELTENFSTNYRAHIMRALF